MSMNIGGWAPVSPNEKRRAKIVGTLGPASSDENVFRELVRAGLDVARLNFSHGSHEQKAELIAMVRKVSLEEKKADLHSCRSARAENSLPAYWSTISQFC